jgi:hypothetical protein
MIILIKILAIIILLIAGAVYIFKKKLDEYDKWYKKHG